MDLLADRYSIFREDLGPHRRWSACNASRIAKSRSAILESSRQRIGHGIDQRSREQMRKMANRCHDCVVLSRRQHANPASYGTPELPRTLSHLWLRPFIG